MGAGFEVSESCPQSPGLGSLVAVAADARGRLWNSLRGLLPAGCHATRIENELTGEHAGFPDVHYTYLERSGTIELKSVDKLPMKKSGVRDSQVEWINREVEAGGQVWIIVEFKKFVYIVNGLYVEILNDLDADTLPTYAAALWTKGISDSEKAAIIESLLLNKA